MGSMRLLAALYLAGCLAACTTVEHLAVPAKRLHHGQWALSDPDSVRTVDHSIWDRFLNRYTVEDGAGIVRVRYADVAPEDKAALEAYVASLEAVDVPALSRPVQLAYWINLYNAVTVRIVLENYPLASIRDAGSGFVTEGPWNTEVVTVGGHRLSLNDIEHRILRAGWDDPRIHYTLNCAAVQCPDLARQAYRGADIDERLDQAARDYINDPRGVTVLPSGNLQLSKIYAWYRNDFGGSHNALLKHLRRFAEWRLQKKLMQEVFIDRYEYDWSLNDAAGAHGATGE